ncbi:MAG: aldehyde ferredoxin oxidoreductase N-terminal domain-containing protein, partial [Sedimentisphaerales bacterium]|nr:aldehyde ferredoxin oxidoreductase N-terminal domain-containing protein [Sedimentisphaerales bacterium]
MYGYYNKLLKINLTAKNFSEEDILDDVLEKHLGGKGLGAYLMLKEIQPGIDPLSEKNKLIFTVGPVTGSQLWGSSRYGVFAKSPLTGIFGESYSGGKVAPCIKACGYDAIIIEGKSDRPTYLEITQGKVMFHDASHLWGKDTYQSEDALLAEVGVPNAQAVVIGPAGENLVRFAVIENDYWRSAGRCGMGAVCGSKKLKGIVFHGNAKCEFADTDLLKKLIRDLSKKSRENLRLPAKIWRERGTVQTVEAANNKGCFPTRYWSEGRHEHWENLNAEYMLENFEVKC